jgi:hypothetical protein
MTWDKRFWVQPQSFYRIKSVHWWKFLFKNVTENHNSGPKINKNPTENRQKTDTGVGFSIFLCRFLSVLKNRQKPTKSCRFSDTKPTSILSVAILGYDFSFFCWNLQKCCWAELSLTDLENSWGKYETGITFLR